MCLYDKILNSKSSYIIAEISANHNGDKSVALETVRAAKRAGADAVKIQTYTPDTLTLDVKNDDFLYYISQRLVLERQVRNKNIMEKQAHIMYENVIGEKQARKVQNDQDIYAQKVKEAREKGVLKPNQDFDAETKERIFRSIKPSRYNVYRGQPDKTLDQDVDIVANIKEQ